MNDRIVKLMKVEGLTNSKFASILGIQRSNVTHIIDGRNKPSIRFIEKLIKKFPSVNIEWLITGNGEMYKQSKISVQESEQKKGISPTLFPEIDIVQMPDNQTKANQNVSQNVEEEIREGSKVISEVTNIPEFPQISNIQVKDLNVQQVQEPMQILELKPEAATEQILELKLNMEQKSDTEIKPELELKLESKIEAEKETEMKEKTEIKAETKAEISSSSRTTKSDENIENERKIECVLIFHSDKTFQYYKPG
jgi:plasmid maintenance system antidote protein VapI